MEDFNWNEYSTHPNFPKGDTSWVSGPLQSEECTIFAGQGIHMYYASPNTGTKAYIVKAFTHSILEAERHILSGVQFEVQSQLACQWPAFKATLRHDTTQPLLAVVVTKEAVHLVYENWGGLIKDLVEAGMTAAERLESAQQEQERLRLWCHSLSDSVAALKTQPKFWERMQRSMEEMPGGGGEQLRLVMADCQDLAAKFEAARQLCRLMLGERDAAELRRKKLERRCGEMQTAAQQAEAYRQVMEGHRAAWLKQYKEQARQCAAARSEAERLRKGVADWTECLKQERVQGAAQRVRHMDRLEGRMRKQMDEQRERHNEEMRRTVEEVDRLKALLEAGPSPSSAAAAPSAVQDTFDLQLALLRRDCDIEYLRKQLALEQRSPFRGERPGDGNGGSARHRYSGMGGSSGKSGGSGGGGGDGGMQGPSTAAADESRRATAETAASVEQAATAAAALVDYCRQTSGGSSGDGGVDGQPATQPDGSAAAAYWVAAHATSQHMGASRWPAGFSIGDEWQEGAERAAELPAKTAAGPAGAGASIKARIKAAMAGALKPPPSHVVI